MTKALQAWIEPFDPERHDRTEFSCGVTAVDNFLKQTANKLSKADNLRVFVMTNDTRALIGFYSMNASEIRYEHLPPRFARTRPGHGSIPTVYLSMMGVDKRYLGLGYGGDLLMDALDRTSSASPNLGIALILLDVLDCGDAAQVARRKAFYENYGFRPTVSDPLKLFMPVASIPSARPTLPDE